RRLRRGLRPTECLDQGRGPYVEESRLEPPAAGLMSGPNLLGDRAGGGARGRARGGAEPSSRAGRGGAGGMGAHHPIVAAAGGGAGCYLARRWSSVLNDLAQGLEALRVAEKAHVIRARAPGSLGGLVRSFNAAATDIQARMAQLDQDRQQVLVVLEAMA